MVQNIGEYYINKLGPITKPPKLLTVFVSLLGLVNKAPEQRRQTACELHRRKVVGRNGRICQQRYD